MGNIACMDPKLPSKFQDVSWPSPPNSKRTNFKITKFEKLNLTKPKKEDYLDHKF